LSVHPVSRSAASGSDTLGFLIAALVIHLSAPQAFITAPVFVEAMVKWAQLTPAQAGYVQAAESLGKALAAISLLFFVHKIEWRRLVRFALALLVVGNLVSIFVTDFTALAVVRFVCGMAPGMVVPIAYAMVGMTAKRERNFGWLLTTLLMYGAVAFTVLPVLYAKFGLAGGLVFYAAFALIGLLATGAVPATAGGDAAASVDAQSDARADAASGVLHTLPSRLRPVTVLTLGFYFIGMMGAWAYFSLIAAAGGVAESSISGALASSQIFGILGGLLVVVTGDRLGRLWPITAGLLATVGALLLLEGHLTALTFTVSAFAFAFFWNHTHPYLLSAISSFDRTGKLVVYATVAQMCGVAIGPALAARLLGESGDYTRVVSMCAMALGIALACILPALLWQRRTPPAVEPADR
jgi:predicted MFS family arabinose efflux permease